MKKLQKYLVIGGATLIGIIGLSFLFGHFSTLIGPNLCDNTLVETKNAPGNFKKVIIFTSDCGATTGWVTKAAILDPGITLDDRTTANALSIDSNDGKAFPVAPEGWPIIRAEWKDSNNLELRYSNNAAILYQKTEVDGVRVIAAPIQ